MYWPWLCSLALQKTMCGELVYNPTTWEVEVEISEILGQHWPDILIGNNTVTKPNELNSVPRTHMAEEETLLCKFFSHFHNPHSPQNV